MNPQDDELLLEQMIRHEGLRFVPYKDTVGKWTIGIGRNIDDKPLTDREWAHLGHGRDFTKRPLTKPEAIYLWKRDIAECVADLSQFPWWEPLNDVRQRALIDLRFNLGPSRFRGFSKMIRAIKAGDFDTAAAELLDSKWRTDVGSYRSNRLSDMLKLGEDRYL
jgi:lysozyme